jgi:DNA-binding transcriptional LysR family regulator
MKPQINLRHVEVFRSVMLAGSVVGAAKLLSVTQPGVSRTIGLLELRLGYSLFERRGRRLVPTAEAETLYHEVEQTYLAVDRIAQVAADLRFQRAGALRVATLPALAQWLVPQAIARFIQDRPQVSVFVQSLPSRQIANLVSTRQFDVGVIELPMPVPAIRTEPLPEVPTVAVLPSSHPLARKRQISVKDLGNERMVLLSQPSYVRFGIDEAFSAAGVVPQVVIETPTSPMACALVAAGAGIALASRWTALPFAGPTVAVLPLKEQLHSRFALVFPEAVPISSLARAFCDELKALLKDA